MSNWNLSPATRHETLGENSGDGVTVTGSNTGKGSYATIGTTTFHYNGFWLMMVPNNSGAYLVDIAIGGSDYIIWPDLMYHANNAGINSNYQAIWVPLRIASGTAIKVRARSATNAHTLRVMIIGQSHDAQGPSSYSRIVNLNSFDGVFSSNSAGTLPGSANTNTAWIELISSVPANVGALYVIASPDADVSRTAGRIMIDIGIGAAASEALLFTLMAANLSTGVHSEWYGPIQKKIVAGVRLAWRARHSTTSSDGLALAAYGLVP